MLETYIRPGSERCRLSEAFVWEIVPDNLLGCNPRILPVQQLGFVFKCYGFFQVNYLGMSLKAVDNVSEVTNNVFGLPVEEKFPCTNLRLIKGELCGFNSNKDFKSATTGFYTKGDTVHFQNIKWIKCSKGGRVENIAPGHIRRLRRRRNKKDKDDEDDGEDNRRWPSDSHGLSFILGIVIILMLFLIVLSLISSVMS